MGFRVGISGVWVRVGRVCPAGRLEKREQAAPACMRADVGCVEVARAKDEYSREELAGTTAGRAYVLLQGRAGVARGCRRPHPQHIRSHFTHPRGPAGGRGSRRFRVYQPKPFNPYTLKPVTHPRGRAGGRGSSAAPAIVRRGGRGGRRGSGVCGGARSRRWIARLVIGGVVMARLVILSSP